MKNMLSWNFKRSPLRDLFTYVRHSFQSIKELITQKFLHIKGNVANVCSSESVYSHEKDNYPNLPQRNLSIFGHLLHIVLKKPFTIDKTNLLNFFMKNPCPLVNEI